MASPLFYCPRCSYRLPQRPAPGELEPLAALEGPPSPRGSYAWGGWTWKYDVGRIAFLLGRRPDALLARAISCPTGYLTDFRQSLGVPAYRVLRGFEHLLGKMADGDVAKRAGCSKQTVRIYRNRKNIPPIRRSAMHAERILREYLDDVDREFGGKRK